MWIAADSHGEHYIFMLHRKSWNVYLCKMSQTAESTWLHQSYFGTWAGIRIQTPCVSCQTSDSHFKGVVESLCSLEQDFCLCGFGPLSSDEGHRIFPKELFLIAVLSDYRGCFSGCDLVASLVFKLVQRGWFEMDRMDSLHVDCTSVADNVLQDFISEWGDNMNKLIYFIE